MSWLTRWSMGAVEVTQGQLALAAEVDDFEALLAFAGAPIAAGTASSPASAAAAIATSRHDRYLNPCFRASLP
ncbi:MAG TPA: hypothetical protein VMG13_06290 [Trebonia sp.]|nr:hypothetical protein [Trebonia sp.]